MVPKNDNTPVKTKNCASELKSPANCSNLVTEPQVTLTPGSWSSLKGYDIVCWTVQFFWLGLLHMTVYSETVEKSQQVANARIAKNHSRHLIKPRGSFNTRVSITFDPIGGVSDGLAMATWRLVRDSTRRTTPKKGFIKKIQKTFFSQRKWQW